MNQSCSGPIHLFDGTGEPGKFAQKYVEVCANQPGMRIIRADDKPYFTPFALRCVQDNCVNNPGCANKGESNCPGLTFCF